MDNKADKSDVTVLGKAIMPPNYSSKITTKSYSGSGNHTYTATANCWIFFKMYIGNGGANKIKIGSSYVYISGSGMAGNSTIKIWDSIFLYAENGSVVTMELDKSDSSVELTAYNCK